jgi:hypothetical protein
MIGAPSKLSVIRQDATLRERLSVTHGFFIFFHQDENE